MFYHVLLGFILSCYFELIASIGLIRMALIEGIIPANVPKRTNIPNIAIAPLKLI